jgi:ribonuclease VapC
VVIETSAIVAIFFGEAERDEFLEKIDRGVRCVISAAAVVESSMVLRRDIGEPAVSEFHSFLELFSIEVVSFDYEQALIADEAFAEFGKGMKNRAKLNLGDLYSYALAKKLSEPLLFKGDDFIWTDVLKA